MQLLTPTLSTRVSRVTLASCAYLKYFCLLVGLCCITYLNAQIVNRDFTITPAIYVIQNEGEAAEFTVTIQTDACPTASSRTSGCATTCQLLIFDSTGNITLTREISPDGSGNWSATVQIPYEGIYSAEVYNECYDCSYPYNNELEVIDCSNLTAEVLHVEHVDFTQLGLIEVEALGGTPPYSFQWTDGSNYTSNAQNPNDLAAGEYILTLTDDKGCIFVTDPIEIQEQCLDVIVQISSTNSLLAECNGIITIALHDPTPAPIPTFATYEVELIENGSTVLSTFFADGETTLDRICAGNYKLVIWEEGGEHCTSMYDVEIIGEQCQEMSVDIETANWNPDNPNNNNIDYPSSCTATDGRIAIRLVHLYKSTSYQFCG